MGGFSVVEEATAAVGKREYGDTRGNPLFHSQHRRSKSASDRNASVLGGGVLRSKKQDQDETYVLPYSASVSRGQSPLHDYANYFNKNISSNHRASLEKDIEQLQLRLQQEKSMRMLLERTMGRASSTLSPGHRHIAAQTKELIAEIELLEEEVANREQHVLSLYRNIFDSVSRPPSAQNSGMASPAHTKHGSRKHPSIISSAFCSSKKFPLWPLQALVSLDDPWKRSHKTSHTPMSNGKKNIDTEKMCFDQTKVREKVQAMDKTSVLRTLKDHINQCPSKLSEEMVRCMAAVYCWLRSAASINTETNRSPLLSRSSTNVIQPRRGTGEDRDWTCKSMIEISWISTDKSQFSHASYAINNYRVLVEQLERVSFSQMENDAQTAFWINVYNALVMHAYLAYGIPNNSLRRLALFHKEKLQEQKNLLDAENQRQFKLTYETLQICSLFFPIHQALSLPLPVPGAAYNIGGHVISANAIEHAIFCFRTPRSGRWLETILSTTLRKKSGEERQLSSKLGLLKSQPLVCFALCTGAFSDPALKVYTASNVGEEIEAAKREFLQANIVVKKSRKVFLPKVLERYAREASLNSDDILKWLTENVDKKLHDSIQKCIDRKSSKKASQIMEWLPYSSRFRYVFSKDLAEKPWWM